MQTEMLLPMVLRWLHIAAAMIAVGGPFFIRFGLLPAAQKTLDPEAHTNLREAINKRWRHIVYLCITIFLLTGLYNFLVETRVGDQWYTGRWKGFLDDADKRAYHMIFGIKFLAAMVMFVIASALPGRTKTFAPMRKNAAVWLSVLLTCAAVILVCSVSLRYLPRSGYKLQELPAAGLRHSE